MAKLHSFIVKENEEFEVPDRGTVERVVLVTANTAPPENRRYLVTILEFSDEEIGLMFEQRL